MNVLDTLHIFLQSLITIFEKSNTYDNLDYKQLRVLYYSLRRLLGYKQIPLNTANNCGLLVVMLDYNFFELTSSIRVRYKLPYVYFNKKCFQNNFLIVVMFSVTENTSKESNVGIFLLMLRISCMSSNRILILRVTGYE